jgi:phage head maturation protease
MIKNTVGYYTGQKYYEPLTDKEGKQITKMVNGELILQEKEYFRFIISSENPDRSGDVVLIDGVDTTEYEKNSIVLYNHDNTKYPIGNATLTKLNGFLYGDVWFDEIDDVSKIVKRKIEVGTLKTASIGFQVLDYVDRDLTDEEKIKLKRSFKKIRTFTKSILLEWSIVNLPANIDAERKTMIKNSINNLEEFMETKKGSTLSKKNRDLLTDALNNIKAVINEPEDDENEEMSKTMGNEFETLRNDLQVEKEKLALLESEISELKSDIEKTKVKKTKLNDIFK